MSKYIYFCEFFAYLKSSLPFEISKPIYYVEKTKNSWIDFSEFPIYLFSNRSLQYHQKCLTTRRLTKLFLSDFFFDIIPGLTFRKFGKSGIIEAPVMSISHSVIESVLNNFHFAFRFCKKNILMKPTSAFSSSLSLI